MDDFSVTYPKIRGSHFKGPGRYRGGLARPLRFIGGSGEDGKDGGARNHSETT
jgi:hypothetical protein